MNRILGIVNGTTNYILDRMDTGGDTLEEALEAARTQGVRFDVITVIVRAGRPLVHHIEGAF